MGASKNISDKIPESLRHSMEVFQAKNNLPIFLKGGAMDKGLFGLTVALCGVGLIGFAQLVYTMGFKKRGT